MTTAAILTINSGSSSLKFSLWHLAGRDDLQEALHGEIEKIGTAPRLAARIPRGETLFDKTFGSGAAALTHEALLQDLFAQRVLSPSNDRLVAVGHRVVHSGPAFVEPVIIDDTVMDRLSQLEPLAPLHQPHNLSAIRACALLTPGVPQVACFDTALHQGPGRAPARAAPRLRRGRRPAVRLARALLRVYRPATESHRSDRCGRPRDRGASRQQRELCAMRDVRAPTPPWPSPRSTDC